MTDFYSTGLTGLPGLNTSTHPRPGYPKLEQSAFRTGRYPEVKVSSGCSNLGLSKGLQTVPQHMQRTAVEKLPVNVSMPRSEVVMQRRH
jgi:hypothetical protein